MDKIELPDLHKEKEEVLNNKIKPYFNENRMGYIKVPTGWGKTFLAKHIMREYHQDGKIVLFLVSGNNPLLEQTYKNPNSIEPLYPNSVLLSGGAKKKPSPEELLQKFQQRNDGFVVFASLQTINRKGSKYRDILIQNTDLVIVDEIHNFIDNNGNKFIDELRDDTNVFGMTATPFQGIVGNVKFVDDISEDMDEIYNKTLPQCLMDGQLSELDYSIIQSGENISDVFDFEKGLSELNKQDLFIDCGTIEKINLTTKRTYLAKRIYDEKINNNNSKTLIFCAPVKNIVRDIVGDKKKVTAFHSKLCAAIFNSEIKDRFVPEISLNNYSESGQFKNAVYLSSELPREECKKIVEAFKTLGKPPFVLCSVGMLIEGFDFPDLENLILLRPTLSMRLFEQQVGRITRLPHKSNKTRGNIFEIVDDIDSLFDNFGEQLFGEGTFERFKMLNPEIRIEGLFTEGDNTDAIESNKVEIKNIKEADEGENIDIESLEFKGLVGKFLENPVQIPPIKLRVKFFCKLLSKIEEADMGAFRREKERLLEMALGFKIHTGDDAIEISELITLLDRLEQEAKIDKRLFKNCRKHKPQVFHEVKWLLKLRALTYLKYINKNLSSEDKSEILEVLGFERNYEKIDKFRLKCLDEGTNQNINELFKTLEQFKNSEKQFRWIPKITQKINAMAKELTYWASCFTVDHPEFRELFESKTWNYNVKKHIIK